MSEDSDEDMENVDEEKESAIDILNASLNERLDESITDSIKPSKKRKSKYAEFKYQGNVQVKQDQDKSASFSEYKNVVSNQTVEKADEKANLIVDENSK